MHQTFYIDIDEEITSIVEKLRKTETPEAVLVVPKRALLIQSIVNLKLLCKEADSLGLKISIVTQDKLGKMLVAKAGISVQQKIEEDDTEEVEIFSGKDEQRNGREIKKNIKTELAGEVNKSKRRLDKIGSPNYFVSKNEVDNSILPFSQSLSGLQKNESTDLISSELPPRKDSQGIASRLMPSGNEASAVKIKTVSNMDVSSPSRIKKQPIEDMWPKETPADFQEKRNKQVENFFYANTFDGKKEKEKEPEKKSGGFFKSLIIAGAVMLFGGLTYGAYRFAPKAIITISAKKEIKSADMEIAGDINLDKIDYEKMAVPAKIMEFEEEIAESFDATGSKSVSNKKARGKITIYNEFSSASQSLVATTRFLSDNQKIFRLAEGVVVPGTTKVGEEIKPGVLEAEVIADESGEGYNIGPSNFAIPGFKNSGNEKYAKIYAKSLTAMTGGGNSNETAKVVSDKDISGAKDKISLEINSLIKKKIKDSIPDKGAIMLDDAIMIDEPLYRISNSAGEITNNFEIKVNIKARALVFSGADVKKIANSVIIKAKGEGKINIDSGAVIIDYGKPGVDFKTGIIEIKMRASNIMQPEIDLEKIKKDILGKNNDELAGYMKNYPNLEKVEIEYWPPLFVNKIPLYEKRVEVILNAITP
ncbi:MAG TPA: hypothetical protein DCS28_00460 [Candidatus Moranbacteria bacterium]|nr:hypothetical protein [Candidatus Moranbacteria bacterium]HAT74503.1 hypothetical protein [Candidatus Moranbacteria bacterium]